MALRRKSPVMSMAASIGFKNSTRPGTHLACVFVLLTLVAPMTQAQDRLQGAQATDRPVSAVFRVQVVDELVTVTAKDAGVFELVEEIARQSELALVSGNSGDQRISIEFNRLPLREALSLILRHHDFALETARPPWEAPESGYSYSGRLWIFTRMAQSDPSDETDDPAFPSKIMATISALRAELASEDANTREAAVDDLGTLDAVEAISPLSFALGDQDEHVRLAAISALADIGGEQAAAALSIAARDQNPGIRGEAIVALANIGHEAGIRILERALDDEDKDIREAAVAAVAEIGGDDAARAVAIALYDEDVAIREAAVDALAEIGDEDAIDYLQQALNDHNRFVREAAVHHLSALRDLDR